MQLPDGSRYPIELVEHDPTWAAFATRETERLREAIGPTLAQVHHIGSTSVPGLRAKPIVDLMPLVRSLDDMDARRSNVEALGYVWLGELGIEGRRYGVLFDASGRRVAQIHAFQIESPQIERHLAFRDYLRAHPDEARAYETEKLRARALHPDDVRSYNDAKSAWLRACERRALAFYAGRI